MADVGRRRHQCCHSATPCVARGQLSQSDGDGRDFSERAHDEEVCKFTTQSQRTLGKTTVVEQSRSCLPELEERRYVVERPDAKPFELARKRLPRANFAADRYVWAIREDKNQQLVVRIELNGKLMSEFFEEDARP